MAKLTEYPQATHFDAGDILIKDGPNGTKKILVTDALAGVTSNAEAIADYKTKSLHYWNYKADGFGPENRFTVNDMPRNTWVTCSASVVNLGIAEVDGGSFPVDIYNTYAEVTGTSSTAQIFYVLNPSKDLLYVGRRNNTASAINTTSVVWHNKSPYPYSHETPVSLPWTTWTKTLINAQGAESTNQRYISSKLIPCREGDRVYANIPSRDANNKVLSCYVATYGASGFIKRVGVMSTNCYRFEAGETGFRICFGRSTSGDPNMQESDLSYFNMKFYLSSAKAASLSENVLNRIAVPDMFVYTDFDELNGQWKQYWEANEILTDSGKHTQKFEVIPGDKIYLTNISIDGADYVLGAYFDNHGDWIAPIMKDDKVNVQYEEPSCGTGTFNYIPIWEYSVPNDAYYVSLNIRGAASAEYHDGFASKPILTLKNTGNICVKNNPAYNYTSKRKLCVIGASLTATDRAVRQMRDGSNVYLCGWQEYIRPWYDDVITYGYSGGSMGMTTGESITIYKGIVIDQPDLHEYDDFIIFATKNMLHLEDWEVGNWGSIDEIPTGNEATYFGGLRRIVAYIQTQNPNARIYLTTVHNYGDYFKDSNPTLKSRCRTRTADINTQTREMAEKMGFNLIDLAKLLGFNKSNYQKFTSDDTHWSQEGAELAGLAIRKELVGI